MPMQRELYPSNWDDIARAVKDAVNWTCQSCGRPCMRPGEDFYEFLSRVQSTEWAKGLPDEEEFIDFTEREVKSLKTQFILTVAHLNHKPEDCSPKNLKALCAGCHCRYDTDPGQMAIKKRLKAERLGQLSLTL